jgi:hypothetical protein
MNLIRNGIIVLLLVGALSPPLARASNPGDPWKLSLRSDIGDVLRPKGASSGYSWFIGLDGGLTWSSFMNGPLNYYIPNPHNPRYVLPGMVNEGNGIGFYLGATVDLPLSDIFGVVFKGNYHTRVGAFNEVTDMQEIHPETETNLTTLLGNETEWSFNYLAFDVLLRINLGSAPAYLLVGPSFGFLNSNKAKLDQRIVQPDDIYYTEDVNGFDEVVNEFRTASNSAEVKGFMDSRIDLKFGVGWWIELNPDLYLTPEITLAWPLTSFVNADYLSQDHIPTEPAEVYRFWSNTNERTLAETNKDFNMLTAFFTIGLRWRIK